MDGGQVAVVVGSKDEVHTEGDVRLAESLHVGQDELIDRAAGEVQAEFGDAVPGDTEIEAVADDPGQSFGAGEGEVGEETKDDAGAEDFAA